ncbi:MAG: 5'-nucleotidase C-terminal domain-containing protein [Thiotrichales bacterium]|nr:5'-nucleotidase C-terminal domain-containing protein [Thiotrichales bacterium]
MVTFGGDMISPSVLSGIDRGAHMIDLANAVGFDLAVPGNHEFDFGPEVLQERLAESNATWLLGNVDYRGRRGFPGTEPTAMIEKAGYKLGFLGLLTPDTVEISAAGESVTFLPQAEIAAALARELRSAGADLVIALTHNRTSEDTDLLRRVRDIDIVLGGHDHELTAWYDGRQAILKSRSQGRYVGILNLELDRIGGPPRGGAGGGGGGAGGGNAPGDGPTGESRVTWTPNYDRRSTAGVEPDTEVAAMVAGYEAQLDRELGQVIGRTETQLDTRGPVVRSGEAAFGNLVTDALLAATGAEVAITNGGGIRGGRVYPPGTELTPRMLLSELPFGKATVVLGLTGAQLTEALENGVSRAEENDGRFPQVAGLSFAFDVRRPSGSRITRVEVGGAPLEPGRVYRVATNDFMYTGGDGYTAFKSAEVLIDATSGDTMANHLIDYVRTAGSVAPVIEGRIIRED